MLRWFSVFLSLSTLFLIFAGSLVTSTGSGLAVPDWPTTFGYGLMVFPFSQWVGGVFYEHSHRVLGYLVGGLTVCLAVGLWRKEKRSWVKWLGVIAVPMVMLQGILGGITVHYRLPPPVSILHAILAQIFFLVTILLAWSQFHDRARISRGPLLLTALIFLQLIAGAVMRHTQSGLAIPDFPTMGGEWIPKFDSSMLMRINIERFMLGLDPATLPQVIIHFLHRLGAVAIVVTAILVARRFAIFHALLIIQIALGAWTVLSVRDPHVASAHVLVGAALLGAAFLITLNSRRPDEAVS